MRHAIHGEGVQPVFFFHDQEVPKSEVVIFLENNGQEKDADRTSATCHRKRFNAQSAFDFS
jgi:hypothetical protein